MSYSYDAISNAFVNYASLVFSLLFYLYFVYFLQIFEQIHTQ